MSDLKSFKAGETIQTMTHSKSRKLECGNDFRTTAFRTLSVLAAPVMYLYYKLHEGSKKETDSSRKPTTEKELEHLNKRIVSTRPIVHFLYQVYTNFHYLCTVLTHSHPLLQRHKLQLPTLSLKQGL